MQGSATGRVSATGAGRAGPTAPPHLAGPRRYRPPPLADACHLGRPVRRASPPYGSQGRGVSTVRGPEDPSLGPNGWGARHRAAQQGGSQQWLPARKGPRAPRTGGPAQLQTTAPCKRRHAAAVGQLGLCRGSPQLRLNGARR